MICRLGLCGYWFKTNISLIFKLFDVSVFFFMLLGHTADILITAKLGPLWFCQARPLGRRPGVFVTEGRPGGERACGVQCRVTALVFAPPPRGLRSESRPRSRRHSGKAAQSRLGQRLHFAALIRSRSRSHSRASPWLRISATLDQNKLNLICENTRKVWTCNPTQAHGY